MTSKKRQGTEKIIRDLEAQANETARRYLRTVAAFGDEQRRRRMETLIEDLSDWIDENGDTQRLIDLGVEVHVDEGSLRIVQGDRTMFVQPRNDMSVVVGGVIMQPDRDWPVLDRLFYDDVLARIYRWAQQDEHKE